jgi:hypothetical protein
VALCRSYSVNEIVIKVEDDGERYELQFLTLKRLLHDRLSVPESSGRDDGRKSDDERDESKPIVFAFVMVVHVLRQHIPRSARSSSTKTKECKPYCTDYVVHTLTA